MKKDYLHHHGRFCPVIRALCWVHKMWTWPVVAVGMETILRDITNGTCRWCFERRRLWS